MTFSRREFLAATAATVASVGLADWNAALASETSDIRVACIGVRGRGWAHLEALANNVVAICDVDDEVLHKCSTDFESRHRRKVDVFRDFRKLLARQDIDAV